MRGPDCADEVAATRRRLGGQPGTEELRFDLVRGAPTEAYDPEALTAGFALQALASGDCLPVAAGMGVALVVMFNRMRLLRRWWLLAVERQVPARRRLLPVQRAKRSVGKKGLKVLRAHRYTQSKTCEAGQDPTCCKR